MATEIPADECAVGNAVGAWHELPTAVVRVRRVVDQARVARLILAKRVACDDDKARVHHPSRAAGEKGAVLAPQKRWLDRAQLRKKQLTQPEEDVALHAPN